MRSDFLLRRTSLSSFSFKRALDLSRVTRRMENDRFDRVHRQITKCFRASFGSNTSFDDLCRLVIEPLCSNTRIRHPGNKMEIREIASWSSWFMNLEIHSWYAACPIKTARSRLRKARFTRTIPIGWSLQCVCCIVDTRLDAETQWLWLHVVRSSVRRWEEYHRLSEISIGDEYFWKRCISFSASSRLSKHRSPSGTSQLLSVDKQMIINRIRMHATIASLSQLTPSAVA